MSDAHQTSQISRNAKFIVTSVPGNRVRKTAVSGQYNQKIQRQQMVYKEISKNLDIRQFIPRYLGENRDTDGRQYFQVEAFPPGSTDLFEVLEKEKKILASCTAQINQIYHTFSRHIECLRSIGNQILGIVKSLHDHHIAHGDLKPENLMIVQDGAGHVSVRLIDFEFTLLPGQTNLSFRGTPGYIPPQLLQKKIKDSPLSLQQRIPYTVEDIKHYDLWACGVILVTLLSHMLYYELVLSKLRMEKTRHDVVERNARQIKAILSIMMDAGNDERVKGIPAEELSMVNQIMQDNFRDYQFDLFSPFGKNVNDKMLKDSNI